MRRGRNVSKLAQGAPNAAVRAGRRKQTLKVDVRILAATNKDLLTEVKNGNFREDLFYRINVIPIALPALRDRPNDIPLLANHFLGRMAAEQGEDISEFKIRR